MSRFFSITISAKDRVFSCLPDCDLIQYLAGQLEYSTTGHLHWQLFAITKRKHRVSGIRKIFPGHIELSRSSAIEQYVQKSDTGVDGTYFEFGKKPHSAKRGIDWSAVKRAAKSGSFEEIPSYAYISFYNSLRSIARDNLQPVGIERTIWVFWGKSGTGKSHSAWEQAGRDAYPKDPNTKFWDGYNGHEHVVIDEYRGGISISHVLRWFDKYPTIVEVKGSSVPLKARTIWVTSNLNPRDWYKDLDSDTQDALLRRLNIIHFDTIFQ